MNTIDQEQSPPPRDRIDATAGATLQASLAQPGVLEVVEEQLQVGKRIVDSGGIRVHKRVHEDVVQVDVPLTAQQVSVERVAVGRDVDAPVEVRWDGDVMVVPVVEERLVWRKQLVLVEELRIARRETAVHRPQTVTLRREEVVVERIDDTVPRSTHAPAD